MFDGVFDHSIIKLAQKKQVVTIVFVNIRDFGIGRHYVVDDTPYGGGVGMVMRVDVLEKAIAAARCESDKKCREKVILLDPQGKKYAQKKAMHLAQNSDHLILVCGRYEGVDERIRMFVDEEISIGDYVLTGGEIPAMVITDTVVRLLPNVIKEESQRGESFSTFNSQFSTPVLEYPQYTRPETFKEKKVPKILLSGDHKKIAMWRNKQSVKRTQKQRPDLFFQ